MKSANAFRYLAALAFILGFAPTATASFSGLPGAKEADRNATLNRMIGNYPKTLNPIIYSLAVEADIIGDGTIFETLIEGDPDSGEAVCWLCTEYTYAKDKKSALFKLRQDVTFHDGKKLTAADVKFSFDVMVHPKVDNLNLKSGVMSTVERVEVVNDYAVRIHFKEVKYSNIYEIAVPIIPKHLFPYFEKEPEKFNKDTKFGRSPLGSGPYKFRKWQAGKYVELERNDAWWGFTSKDPRFKNLFNFKKIRFKIVTNDNVALQAFKKGEFDFMSLQSYQYDELKNAKDEKVEPIHLEPKVGTSFMFIGWNGRQSRFSDVETRKALALLTDRFSTLDKFSRGLRPPTNGPWGIDSPYQCSKKDCPVVPFDPKAAQALLTKAGWSDSDKNGCLDRTVDGEKQELKFAIMSSDDDWSKNVLGVYTNDMKKAGVCASIRQLDWTAMIKLIDDLNFDAFISGFRSAYPILPRQLWHSDNVGKTGSNTWYFVDKEADKLIDNFEKEFDADKRIKLGQQLHKRIYDSHAVTFHHEGGGCYLARTKDLEGVEVADFRSSCIYWPRWYKKK